MERRQWNLYSILSRTLYLSIIIVCAGDSVIGYNTGIFFTEPSLVVGVALHTVV